MRQRISLEEAHALLRTCVTPLGAVSVPAAAALGRTLARAVSAPLDQPPFDRSPLDGYALRAADTVSASRGINECVSMMQRRNVDTLIVVDDAKRYQGTVSIADIRLTGHVVRTIDPLIRCNTPTVHGGDNAKDCFDLLISSGAPYLVVLDGEERVLGIITKTSMASAMAEQLWG